MRFPYPEDAARSHRSYPDDRPTLAECIREEQGDPIECVYCGRMTDPDHPCHDQDTGE